MVTLLTWLLKYLRQYSRLGIFFALIWLLMNRPFGRHVFIALSAMAFATLMLPSEMMFFARHPLLVLAVPFATGFAGAYLGRSTVGTLVTWVVLGVLAAAIYRAMLEV
jgi:hypothetical protein